MKCECGEEITNDQIESGRYRVDGIPHCKKCYYEKLGDVVEKHPIGMWREYA